MDIATPITDNLNPWEIDPSKITDKKAQEEAEIVIHKWAETLDKELSALLSKNGINIYEFGFIHRATNSPMHIVKGNLYTVTKLTKVTYSELKSRLDKEFEDL